MTSFQKHKVWEVLDKYGAKIMSSVYQSQQLDIDEFLEIEATFKMLKEELRLEVLHDD